MIGIWPRAGGNMWSVGVEGLEHASYEDMLDVLKALVSHYETHGSALLIVGKGERRILFTQEGVSYFRGDPPVEHEGEPI